MKPRSWAVFIVGAAVLYPLAIGPIMAHQRLMAGGVQPGIPGFFKPLARIAELSPAGRNLLLSYLQLWGMPGNERSDAGVHRRYLHD